MRIQSVRIKNFRALKDVTIPFDAVTTFIGPNGVGKSTVLRALDWFFNGKPGSLTENDFSFGVVDEAIEVRVTFGGLTEEDRGALGKYVTAGVDTFTAWKCRSPDGVEILSANAKGFQDFSAIKAASNATKKREFYTALRNSRPDLDLPAASSGTAVDQAMTTWEATHLELLIDAPESLLTNFFGFNSNGKMSGLFDFVLVTADLRASEESVDGRSSIIGQILERSIDRTAADEAIAVIVAESRAKQQQVYEEKFKAQLDAIKTQLNKVLSSYSPGRAVMVSPFEAELKAPRTTFNVTVFDADSEAETTVDRQGHGFQRTLLISALQLLAQSGAASAKGVICLAIEEPELFQHPIQAQAFAKVLRSLAEDAEKRIQVTYATHSPYFLEVKHFDQIRRLTRSPERPPVVSVYSATLSKVKDKLRGIVDADVVDRRLDHNVTNQLAIALFSNRVLLVEGPTELSVLYGIADKSALGSLEAEGISIAFVGGKSSIPLAHAILELIGVPVYVLFDADGGFKERAITNEKAPDTIVKECIHHAAENRKLMRYFGLPETDFPAQAVHDVVAIFEDQIESFMRKNWPEWVVACEELEASMKIKLAKNEISYRMATLRAAGAVPDMLASILQKARGN